MPNQDSNLRALLSPSRCGTFFAPFRSRSANPDGFDSKMKLWISAIEEWCIINRRLMVSLKDIQQIFVSDTGVRPDKECVRLVFSEMKRKSRLVPANNLKASKLWSESNSVQPLIDSYVDPKGWLGWSMKKLVVEPTTWAMSALTTSEEQAYSDLTDMSISDTMKFVCHKSLHELSQNLLSELIRISKAEKQVCFEWQHLMELVMPIVNTIIDAPDGKELLEILDTLVDYLAVTRRIAVQIDNETRLVKIANSDDSHNDIVKITKKDIAMARLLRAKELLTADADKYHNQALRAKQDALDCYNRKELVKAKSLLRSHKRLTACAEQKETNLNNVEMMLEQLENTNSNMMILQAYKDGAEALKIANTQVDNNMTILDDMYDATAEARQLNDEMNQMLNDINNVSQAGNISNTELEAELNEMLADDQDGEKTGDTYVKNDTKDNSLMNDLERRLNDLIVNQEPIDREEQGENAINSDKQHDKAHHSVPAT